MPKQKTAEKCLPTGERSLMNENNHDAYEIDILDLLKHLLKKWWIILLCALICAGGMFAYTKMYVSPQYVSSVLLYVNTSSVSVSSSSVSITSGSISTAKLLVDTYCVILKTRLTLEEVSSRLAELGLNYSASALNGMISYAAVNDTEVFRISVTCSSPEDACTIANTVAQVLPQKITDVVDGASSVRVVDYAIVPTARSSPSYSRQTVIGFAAGAVAAAALIAVIHLLNDTINSEEWLTNTYGSDVPLLSTVPDANRGSGSQYSKYGYRRYYKKYRSYYSSNVADKKQK